MADIKTCFFFLCLCLASCSTITPLNQGSFNNSVDTADQKVDCVLSDAIFYSTADYTLLQCSSSANDFYFIPSSLNVEYDINGIPLIFSQFIKNNSVNIIVKFSYAKEKFIEAFTYLKSINASYNLHMLPINSISIFNSTAIPNRKITYYGISSYGFFEGFILFDIRGKDQIDFMRSLLLNANGFQMNYQFSYLINRGGTLTQKRSQITIYINNINF